MNWKHSWVAVIWFDVLFRISYRTAHENGKIEESHYEDTLHIVYNTSTLYEM